MYGRNSGPNLTNSVDLVANSVALLQNTSQQDITDIFASASDVISLINSINKQKIGLGNVENIGPFDLPISNATQQALNNINRTSLSIFNVANTAPSYFASAASVNAITPNSLGLGNVANTKPSDLPASDAVLTLLAGQNANIYSAINTKADIVNPTFYGTVNGITPAMVGLGNVANTVASYFATASSLNAITPANLGLGNVANTKPSDLPISNATLSALAGVSSNIASATAPLAPLANPTFPYSATVWQGINVSGTSTFYGPVNGITPTTLGLGNVANAKPSDLPVSNATLSMIAGVSSNIASATALLAPLANPTFPYSATVWQGINVSGTSTFYGPVNGISASMVGLGN